MAEAKHSFVDDNPYLVYSPNAEATYVTVEALSVTDNGIYSEQGKAYSPVTVNVSGGGSTKYNVKCYEMSGPDATEVSSFVYQAEWSGTSWEAVGDSPVSEANAGDVLIVGLVEYQTIVLTSTTDFQSADFYPYPLDANDWYFVMPQHDVCLLTPTS